MLGGHFRGVRHCNQVVDIGMVLLEPEYERVNVSHLTHQDYSGQVGRKIRPFLKEIFEILDKLDLNRVPCDLKVLLNTGEKIEDYFISDNLNMLLLLSEQERNSCVLDLKNKINSENDLHAKNKNKFDIELEKSLRYNLGELIYEKFFNEFYQTFKNFKNVELHSRNHRDLWLPLYWPESILANLSNEEEFKKYTLEPLRFSTPKSGSVASFVDEVVKKIENSNYCEIVNLENSYQYYFDTIEENSEKTVSFLTKRDLNTYEEKRNNGKYLDSHELRIIYFCIEQTKPSTTFLASPIGGCFRINTRNTNIGCVAILEFLVDKSEDSQNLFSYSHIIMMKLQLEAKCGGEQLNYKFLPLSLPKKEIVPIARGLIESLPSSGNMNDQFVRGLYYAKGILEGAEK